MGLLLLEDELRAFLHWCKVQDSRFLGLGRLRKFQSDYIIFETNIIQCTPRQKRARPRRGKERRRGEGEKGDGGDWEMVSRGAEQGEKGRERKEGSERTTDEAIDRQILAPVRCLHFA